MVVLIVNENTNENARLVDSIQSEGICTLTAESIRSGFRLLKERAPELVFLEMNGRRSPVADFIDAAEELNEPPSIIVMARKADPEDAAEIMKKGAHDFWIKPVAPERVVKTIQLFAGQSEGSVDTVSGKAALDIITMDEAMERLKAVARRVASSVAAVFVQGESGTGKELFARYIHQHSNRREQPFIAVNCAALPENLLESELFGHEKGAFTGATRSKKGKFELAQRGTLLLDEVTEIPIHLQAKLLRVLQENEVDRVGGQYPIPIDVRVIATTNVAIHEAVNEGRFRSDLYYRLNVIPLKIPPLRHRAGDLRLLSEYFIRKHAADRPADPGRPMELAADALEVMARHRWPGNVRELENAIHRAVLLCDGSKIDAGSLLLDEQQSGQGAGINELELTTVEEMERRLIHKALQSHEGNRTRAAEILGISVRTLRNKLQIYRENGSLEAGF